MVATKRTIHPIHDYAAGRSSGRTLGEAATDQVGDEGDIVAVDADVTAPDLRVRQSIEPNGAGGLVHRAEPRMYRLVVAVAAAAFLLITALWMSRPDWQRLLLFLAIVTVAALTPRQPAPCRPSRSIDRGRRMAPSGKMVRPQRLGARLD